MTLAATIKSSISVDQTVAKDLGSASEQIRKAVALQFTDGAGADQCNLQFSDTRTIAASGSENLDLSGTLANALGAAVFARVKYIKIVAARTNTNNVNFSSPASNGVPGIFMALGDGVSLKPGGVFEWGDPGAAGAVVTASSGDLLTVANSSSGTSVTYDIVILGAST